MIKHKKPWYIWLSILGFVLIWGYIVIHLKVWNPKISSNSDFDNLTLWSRACGNFFKLIIFYFLIIGGLSSYLVDFLMNRMVEFFGIEVVFLTDIIESINFATFYFLGVYISYRLVIWREKNMSHLLTK